MFETITAIVTCMITSLLAITWSTNTYTNVLLKLLLIFIAVSNGLIFLQNIGFVIMK